MVYGQNCIVQTRLPNIRSRLNAALIGAGCVNSAQPNNSYGCGLPDIIFRNLGSFHFSEQYDASAVPRAFAGGCGRGSIQRHQPDVLGAEMKVFLKVVRDQYRTRSRCNHFIGCQSLIRIAFNDDRLVGGRILDGADDLIDLLLTCGIECGAFMFATKQLVGKG